jgi:two-component sensor histidine kinase
MNDGGVYLSSDAAHHLLPFHLRWNQEGELTSISPLLRRYWKLEGVDSEPLRPRLIRPFVGSLDTDMFAEITRLALDVVVGQEGRVLRGEVLPLDRGQGWLLVGVPLVSSVHQLHASDLGLGDLPVHFGLGDQLIAVETAVLAQEATKRVMTELEVKSRHFAELFREKETLLYEVHHRVKNNLQITASLLAIQCRGLPNPEARHPFEQSILRVRAMALVHELLYGMKALSTVDLSVYGRRLCESVCSSLAPKARLSFDSPSLMLTAEVAVPVGLVLNEFLTNAMKHGVSKDTDPSSEADLTVTVVQRDQGFRVTVRDQGPGLPDGSDPFASKGIGLAVVRSVARQLRGEVVLERLPKGLAVSLDVPMSDLALSA